MFHRLGRGERAQDVAQVVGQTMKLEPDLVVAEFLARQTCLRDGVLALLDALLHRAAVIVESDQPLGGAAQVDHDEPDALVRFARMPLDLGDDPSGAHFMTPNPIGGDLLVVCCTPNWMGRASAPAR